MSTKVRFTRVEPVSSISETNNYLLRGLTLAGLNPNNKYGPLYTFYSRVNLIICTILLPLVLLFGIMDNLREFTPGELVKTLQVDINGWGFTIKFAIVYALRHKLKVADTLLEEFSSRCVIRSEQLRLQQVAAVGNRVFLFYFLLYMSFMIVNLADALLNHRPPFYLYNIFIDWRSNQSNYFIVCVYEFALVCIGVLIEQVIDCLPIIYVHTLRTHIQILSERIARDVITSKGKKDLAIHHRRQLIDCIANHRKIIKLASTIRPLISLSIFVQFSVCGTVLGLTVINLMFFADLTSGISSTIYFLAVVMQTFPICYLCNCLVDDCHHLADALFHSRWYYKDRTYHTILLSYLPKLHQPVTFSALGMFSISIKTNIKFAKFAFTVYTLAKEAKLDELFTK